MNSTSLSSLLATLALDSSPVIDTCFSKKDYVAIDLSEANPDLNQFDNTSAQAWESYIKKHLTKQSKAVAYGGYLEQRNIYERSTYFNTEAKEKQRNIHLGIDLWVGAGTAVLAVLDGEIHSFKDNTHYGDYGPTIMLKHQIEGLVFYTLYGHLSRASLLSLKRGVPVRAGEQIATLGTSAVNGDYAPHLHFQIIQDLQGMTGDYPGVSSQGNLAFYKSNCPDPNLILGLEAE